MGKVLVHKPLGDRKDRRPSSPVIEDWQDLESREWSRFQELDARAQELKEAGEKEFHKIARSQAVKANRRQIRALDGLLRVHTGRLVGEERTKEHARMRERWEQIKEARGE